MSSGTETSSADFDTSNLSGLSESGEDDPSVSASEEPEKETPVDAPQTEKCKKDCAKKKMLIYAGIGILILLIIILAILLVVFLFLYISEKNKNDDTGFLGDIPTKLHAVTSRSCRKCRDCPCKEECDKKDGSCKDCKCRNCCDGKEQCDKCIGLVEQEDLFLPGFIATKGFLTPPIEQCEDCWTDDGPYNQIIYDPSEISFIHFWNEKEASLRDLVDEYKDKYIPAKASFKCSYECKDIKTGTTYLNEKEIEANGKAVAKAQCWAVALEDCIPKVAVSCQVTALT